MDITNGFADSIHQARRRRGMTQSMLGAIVGVSQAHISQLERGRSSDAATIKKICDFLEIDFAGVLAKSIGAVSAVENEILNDPTLRSDDRELLGDIYKLMQARGPLAAEAV